MDQTLVRELMTTDLFTIERHLKITQALELMRAEGIRRLPVISRIGRLEGMITLNDVRIALPKGATALGDSGFGAMVEETPLVGEVMADYVQTIGPDQTVADAAKMMAIHKISGLPVVLERKVIGIITESDVFRFVAEQYQPKKALVAA
jgi:acetoin utilization protein AcuB